MALPIQTKPVHRLARWWDDLVRPMPGMPAGVEQQSRLMTGLLLALAGIFAAFVPVLLVVNRDTPWWASGAALTGLIVIILLALVRLSRAGRCRLAAGLLIAFGLATIFAQTIIVSQRNENINILDYLAVVLVFAGLFFDLRTAAALLAAIMIGMLLLLFVPGITFGLLLSPLQFNLVAGVTYLLIRLYHIRLEKSRRETLRQSEARYRELVEAARDLVYTHSLNGELLSINYVAEALGGWSKDEMIGRPFTDFIHPDDLSAAMPAFEQLLAGKTPDLFRARVRTKTGVYLWMEFNSMPIFQDGVLVGAFGIGRLVEERQQIEDALRRSEELYRTLIHNFPDGIVLLFDHDLRYQIVDGQGLSNIWLTREMLEGKTIWEALEPEVAEQLDPMYRAALAGTPQTFDVDYAARSYRVQVVPVKNDRGEVIAGLAVAQDMTRQKQVEERLRAIFEYSADAIFIMEPDSGRIVDCNPAACQMNGYTREELIGQPISMVNATGETATFVNIEKARQFGSYRFEFLHRRKDGTIFPIEVMNTVLNVGGRELLLGIDRDITERKQAEAALRRSEERYRTLVRNFPNGMVALFDHDLRYTVVGGQGLAQLGLNEQTFEGKRLRDIFPPEVYERDEPALLAALAGETTVVEAEYGGHCYVVHTLPVHDENGQVIGGMVMTQDVTEARQMQEKQLKLALERERLALVNQFVQAISHDFRTSLSVIETSRHLIERSLEPGARQRMQRKMLNIQEQITRISDQLDNLHMIAGIVTAKRGLCDLNEIIGELVNEQTPLAERKHLSLTFDPAADLSPITANGQALHQAVRHLLVNAINYTPQGGSVAVKTTPIDGKAVIEISDTGIGISADDLPRVFDLFYRADPARGTASGGVGIGLTIVKLVVESHGGQVTVESQPDAGATFRITLPLNV